MLGAVRVLSIAPGSPRAFGADTSTGHICRPTLYALTVFFLAACLRLSSQEPRKSTPPDQKAFSAARKISDPQQKIDALRKFVAHYPKSTRAGSANELIFETLVKDFPSRISEIQKQIGIALKHAKGDYDVYDDIAGTLADHDVLLQQAQALSRKSLKMLKEPQFTKAMKKDYSQAKMPAPDDAAIHREFVKAHASFEATLGRIYVKVGKVEEGERLLSEAYAADPNDSVAAAILGDFAVKAGHDDAALKYFVRARLTGKLTAGQQTSLEAVYSKSHGGSTAGMEEFLDEEYETTFPIPFAVDRYQASPKRSNRTVLAELFTGAGCDPCAGADIAIDADLKRYSRQELAVLMFHQHIPEPDPLTNPASVQRFAFYDASGTPTIAIDGTTKIVGAPRDRAKSAFDEIGTMIDKDLELPAEASLKLTARLDGARVRVSAVPYDIKSRSPDLRLEIVLVEDRQRYSGENGIRFHPMVVRSVANSEENGFSIDPMQPVSIECSFDVSQISSGLKAYLDDYEQHNDRFGKVTFIEKKYEIDPANSSVVALLQDVKTKHVLQAAYAQVTDAVTGPVARR